MWTWMWWYSNFRSIFEQTWEPCNSSAIPRWQGWRTYPDHDAVEGVVIHVKPPNPIFFLHKKYRDRIGTNACSYHPCGQYHVDQVLNVGLLDVRVTVWSNIDGAWPFDYWIRWSTLLCGGRPWEGWRTLLYSFILNGVDMLVYGCWTFISGDPCVGCLSSEFHQKPLVLGVPWLRHCLQWYLRLRQGWISK